MKKHILSVALGLLSIIHTANGQQWSGGNNNTDPIYRTGFVKIGNNAISPSNPITLLDVDASNAPVNNLLFKYAVRIFNSQATSQGLYVQSSTTASQSPVLTLATSSPTPGANPISLASFYSNGKIGFGTTFENGVLPTDFDAYRLYVRDGIRTERIKLDIASAKGWADFVFEKDYKLLPLTEVQQYITQHKHLPDVPSAEELAKKGLEVGEMQKIQMQKIEELMLYLLEQKKEIDTLKQRIAELEKK